MHGRVFNPFDPYRRTPVLAVVCALLIACGMYGQPAAAGRPVGIYQAPIASEDSTGALQDAMRAVLVRATGRLGAANDPALSALVMNAAHYVKSYQPRPDGGMDVVFDGAAIEQAIAAAGRSVWDSDRPFTLIVLSPQLTGTADNQARGILEQVAQRRGLPVSLVPLPLVDDAGNPLSRDALLQSARKLGGNAVLIGRSDVSAAPTGPPGASGSGAANGSTDDSMVLNGQWQWTLLTYFTDKSWTGPLDAGVNGAVDALARVEGGALPTIESDALVQVSGISTLADYAAVSQLLKEIPGANSAGLQSVDGTSATFRIRLRGGADAVQQALAGSQHFVRSGVANARLLYRYQP